RQDVGELPAVVLAPDLRAITPIHELRLHDESVASMKDAPAQHGSNTELAADALRIRGAALVTGDRAARHDPDSRQLRQTVDDALGDSVGEVLRIGIPAQVFEWQHGHRLDGTPLTAGRDRGRHRGIAKDILEREGYVASRVEPHLGVLVEAPNDQIAEPLR